MSYSEKLFCVVSKDDPAIDFEKSEKEQFQVTTLDGRILIRTGLKYERTRDLNDLVFYPNKNPMKLYLQYVNHATFHFLSRHKSEPGTLYFLYFVHCVAQIENVEMENGETIAILKPASKLFSDKEIEEYLPGYFSLVEEIGEVAYKHNFLRRKNTKDYAALLF